MFGGTHNLAAGTVAAVGAATTAVPQVQNDIRMAFTGGAVVSPIFTDHLFSLVRSLEMFNAAPLNVGGGAQTEASIRADPDLEALRVTLEMLANGRAKRLIPPRDLARLRPTRVRTLRTSAAKQVFSSRWVLLCRAWQARVVNHAHSRPRSCGNHVLIRR